MQVSDDDIFLEFHNRRLQEYFPAQYFINEKHLVVTRKTFYMRYRKWRLARNFDLIILGVPQYLTWLARYYNVDVHPLMDKWKTLEPKKLPYNSLTISATIFYTTYKPDIMQLITLMGISYSALKNCERTLTQ